MRDILTKIWRLSKIAMSGRAGKLGLALYGVILGLSFCSVWLSLQMIAWNKAFYDALEQMDGAEAARQIGVFFLIVGGTAGSRLVQDWLRDDLRIRWRRQLTQRALDLWVDGRSYWHLRPGFSAAPIDNPDQRVAQDCDAFVDTLIRETLDLISSTVALFSYVTLLWSLSSFALSFSLWGLQITLPRYMFWAAFVYVAASSLITHLLGRRLKARLFVQEKREADFRHALIQLRENAESIARSGAEATERRRFERLFEALAANWRRVINQRFRLGLFATPYTHTILRIPNFLAAPTYFAGAVTLGGMMQLGSAFGSVSQTLSWFIFSYRTLAAWAAVTDRLDGLFAAASNPAPMPDTPRAVMRRISATGPLTLRNLALVTPAGDPLAPVPDFSLHPGERLWLCGPSGMGKSTLLAAISGLWPYGHGDIEVPGGHWLIVPQSGCLSPEGLAASLSSPQTRLATGQAPMPPPSLAEMAEVLRRVGLASRIPLLELAGPLSTAGLSQGQIQRLAIARVLLARPDVLLLDEATSALDPLAEQEMLALIRHDLPDAAVICVAHRPPDALHITRRIAIGAAMPRATAAS